MFLISHRGNDSHGFSENSKEAILSSLNKPYIDGVEFDVHLTKDNKLVLIHDSVIDFISNGKGLVKYMTLDELKNYKYGKSKEDICTLDELLSGIKSNKILLIELKELGNDYIRLVDKTIEVINKYNSLNIFISSFNYFLINYIRSNYPNVKCGLIVGYGLNTLKLNNNFYFNEVSYHYINIVPKKEYLFVFNVKEKDIGKLKTDTYFITDSPHKYINYK